MGSSITKLIRKVTPPEFIEKKVPLPEEVPAEMPEQIKDLQLAPGSKNFYISQDAPMGVSALYQSYLDPKRFDLDAAQGKRGETFFRTKIGGEELDLLPMYADDEEEGIASLLGYRRRLEPLEQYETIMFPNPAYATSPFKVIR